MANSQKWIDFTRPRDLRIAHGYAMPIGVLLPTRTLAGIYTGGVEVFTQGCSVPISRGSPPTSG